MAVRKPRSPTESSETPASERLESWKEISAYLKRDERTARRWEKEGLPVYRLAHAKKATVYSYKSDIDAWWKDGRTDLKLREAAVSRHQRWLSWWAAAVLILVSAGSMAIDVAWIRNRFLARPAADNISSTLTPRTHALVDGPGRVNPVTYDAFAKGIYFTEKVTAEGIAKGIEYFTHAIDIEPNYAPAYAGLADAYNRAAIQNFRPAKEVYPAAKLAVSRALQLDDTLAEALIISGVIKFRFDWDWVGAERDLKAGLELNPNSSRAHLGYSTYLLTMKRIDDAVRIAQRNVELDPQTVQRHIDLAWKLSYAGRPDEAITHLKEALEIAPDSANVYGHLGSNYAAKQMFVDALAMCERALNLETAGFVTSDCGRVYVQAGRRPEAFRVLQHLLSQSSVQQYGVARLYDALGDHEQAVHWMVQAYEARAPEMCFLQIDTLSASLRADPRFQDILRRMKFPA